MAFVLALAAGPHAVAVNAVAAMSARVAKFLCMAFLKSALKGTADLSYSLMDTVVPLPVLQTISMLAAPEVTV